MKLAAIWHIALAAACAALSGCAVVVLMNMEPEQRAALFLVPVDKAVVYFYRDDANDDTLPLALSIDGNPVGETAPAKFLFYEIVPGRHILASSGAVSDSVELDADHGFLITDAGVRVYFHRNALAGGLRLVSRTVPSFVSLPAVTLSAAALLLALHGDAFAQDAPPETPRGPGIAIADVITGISAFSS